MGGGAEPAGGRGKADGVSASESAGDAGDPPRKAASWPGLTGPAVPDGRCARALASTLTVSRSCGVVSAISIRTGVPGGSGVSVATVSDPPGTERRMGSPAGEGITRPPRTVPFGRADSAADASDDAGWAVAGPAADPDAGDLKSTATACPFLRSSHEPTDPAKPYCLPGLDQGQGMAPAKQPS